MGGRVEVETPRFQVVPVPGVFSRGRWRCSDWSHGSEKKDTDFILNYGRNARTAANAVPEEKPPRVVVGPVDLEAFRKVISEKDNETPQVKSTTFLVTSIETNLTCSSPSVYHEEIENTPHKKIEVTRASRQLYSDETPPKTTTSIIYETTDTPFKKLNPEDDEPNLHELLIRTKMFRDLSTLSEAEKVAAKVLLTAKTKAPKTIILTAPATPSPSASATAPPTALPTFNSRFEVTPVLRADPAITVSKSESVLAPEAAKVAPSALDGPNTSLPPNVVEEDAAASSAAAGNSNFNAAAIDSKIEQAMDLVKTHLTYAVREQVDVLRQTIADLEQKVSLLQKENTVLRQHVPAEALGKIVGPGDNQSTISSQ
ncbi:unnamed protein product [Caenorhabditis auriculariae]|uniref:Uncharacterized protein n=1 Tax=Caenorhabditis auriculariae TaxID=2777116 RepID=A0A8S1H7Q5_9PELO|nr:unnamed protein product [Caenorhabditis auriculariae]